MTKALVYLEFEQSIADLDLNIATLRKADGASSSDLAIAIEQLRAKNSELLRALYENLSAWQTVQVARHPARPYTLDYVNLIFTDFHELHGDRHLADDPAIVAGLARFNDQPCAVVGHQKGRDVKERALRNFGYPRPEGYRKALRIFRLAEKFGLPVFTFIDTPGAWPGIEAEEHNQSEAIGRNLMEMASLHTPIISTVIGEGGSGGALAIGVCDCLAMLQHATYSVISPESCSVILWKDTAHTAEAANELALTATRLKALNLIDKIVEEPTGGAHRDSEAAAANVKRVLQESLEALQALTHEELLERRFERLRAIGCVRESIGHPAHPVRQSHDFVSDMSWLGSPHGSAHSIAGGEP
jgi:acetyl-CoA carboxylase carboxyl transferase subunit alpha